MSGQPSHAVTLALAYLRRTGCKPAAAAARYAVNVSSVRRAMHRSQLFVRAPGRPKKGT
ncbi:MAG: hypothetical protein QG619_1425 [Pseudomonadota bacterium]|nr:hypothetical protein [Pseudomonadota bacterium]